MSNVSAPSVSLDGTNIAFIRNGKVWAMNIDGSNPVQLFSSLGEFNNLTWSPDSKFIAAVRKSKLYNISLETLEMHEIEKSHLVDEESTLTWSY